MAPGRSLRPFFALACLLVVVGVGTAAADEPTSPSEEAGSYVPGWTSQPAQEEAAEVSSPEVLAPPTDPQAAESLPHDDLGRSEASELLTAVFGEVLEEAAGIYGNLDVERFTSDYAAVVKLGASGSENHVEGEEPGLLTSTLPLRTENSEGIKVPVDLDLEYEAGALQPENPLVDISIPSEIGQGISLPDIGITIDLPDAPTDRSPTTTAANAAFYPNVAADSDMAVAPIATGVETSAILRTPDAPLAQTYHLTLPTGARLDSTQEGGATVSKAGSPLLTVPAPTAFDAAGNPIPVELEVSGTSLITRASPSETAVYPILVDPIFESYYWDQYPSDHSPEWVLASTGYPFNASWDGNVGGVSLTSFAGYSTPGSQAMVNYYVPRFFSDFNDPTVAERPSSWIKNMTMTHTYFAIYNYPEKANPVMQLGLWGEKKGAWVSYYRMYGTEAGNLYPGWVFNFINTNEVSEAKNGGVSLSTPEGTSYWRSFHVGQATVEITDPDNPEFGAFPSPSSWVNGQATVPITYKVTDRGLGIYQIQAERPLLSGGYSNTTVSVGCAGSARNACPRTVQGTQKPIPYDPATMPQGENSVKLTASDPIGHQSSVGVARVKVDHTKPTLNLAGALTEQAKLGISADKYALTYNTNDGDSTTPTALSPFGTAGIGIGKLQRPMGVAVDNAGNSYVVDRECKCVQKYSASGAFVSQFGSPGSGPGQFSDPRGIGWSSGSNRLLVTDLVKHSVQIFTSTGGFVREITNSAMTQPFAIAGVPNQEKFWVTDLSSRKVFLVREDGVFGTTVARGTQADPAAVGTDIVSPSGVAVSATSLVVTDSTLDRIFVFDTSGKFATQFGSTGSGEGQLREPVGVALAPNGNVLVADSVNNRIQEFKIGGKFLRQFGGPGSGANQLSEARGMAFGRDRVAYIADAGNKRITKWAHADFDPQSGVAKVEVKVDSETPEVLFAQACPIKDCEKTGEWTYNANKYSSGQHYVTVTVTDSVGLSTAETLSINSIKDTTAPQLSATNAFYTAPKGWLEQKTYSYATSAKDVGGRGVTSLVLKVDGKTLASSTQSCPSGGCERALSGNVNMATYDGGAHSAELIATDGAGLWTKKVWTINVDPKGVVTPAESEDTLEAVESTAPLNIVGSSKEEQLEGTAPGLEFEEAGSELKAVGTVAPMVVDREANGGFSVEIPTEAGLVGCGEEGEEELFPGTCSAAPPLERIEITPVNSTEAISAVALSTTESAGIVSNQASHVDLITRPLYDGGMTFTAIRDVGAPETFSWQVEMSGDQTLALVDSRHAQVYYEDGEQAFSITAITAHDAVGTSVPTWLTVANDTLTLHVGHRGASFIYPVVGGAGWEGGWQTLQIEGPPPKLPEGGEEEGESEVEIGDQNVYFRQINIGPPVLEFDATAQVSSKLVPKRKFYANECAWTGINFPGLTFPKRVQYLNSIQSQQCHGTIDYGQYGKGHVRWAFSISGRFGYEWGNEVWPVGGPNCSGWGEDKEEGEEKRCEFASWAHQSEHVDALAGFRWKEGTGDFGSPGPHCLELDAVLPASPKYKVPTAEKVWRARYHLYRVSLFPGEECPWRNFPSNSEVPSTR